MKTFVERVEFLRDAVRQLNGAVVPNAPELYRREAAMAVLGGQPQPATLVMPLSIGAGATFKITIQPDGRVYVRIDLGLRDNGTIPSPDPYHVLAGMLATEELQNEAQQALTSALELVRGYTEEEPCDGG